MPKVFISYRRSDDPYAANLIYDRLCAHFGKESVYLDIDDIPPGIDFRKHIREAVAECDVLLAIIGARWLEADENGQSRLENPADFVRLEIEAALARNIPVVPVPVGRARLPRENELPSVLADLAYRNACEVRAGVDLQGHITRLLKGIERVLVYVAEPPSEVTPQPGSVPDKKTESVVAANTRTESVEEAPPWAAATGTDSYGRWAAFELGDQSYRLRWIKPGEFLMGSPDEEPECSDNEALHTVTLSHGYWLAETAVSQALWQHVAGGNPSHFEGADLPVEQVSFDDIKNEFLPELNRILPAFNAQLPTEAQWEYACRAGTSTPFHFGDSLTTGLANYDGDYPYNGQKKGEYRSKTIPVSDLQINPWGLYQMHGNVWEWCADSPREFKKGETVVDPIGLEGQERVLRGGSWCGRGRSLRSACRLGFGPSLCGCNYGFRLAQVPEGLRSS